MKLFFSIFIYGIKAINVNKNTVVFAEISFLNNRKVNVTF